MSDDDTATPLSAADWPNEGPQPYDVVVTKPRTNTDPTYPVGAILAPLDCRRCGWPVGMEVHQGGGDWVPSGGSAEHAYMRLLAKVEMLQRELDAAHRAAGLSESDIRALAEWGQG